MLNYRLLEIQMNENGSILNKKKHPEPLVCLLTVSKQILFSKLKHIQKYLL